MASNRSTTDGKAERAELNLWVGGTAIEMVSPRIGMGEGDKEFSQHVQVLPPTTGCAGIPGLQLLLARRRPRDVRPRPYENNRNLVNFPRMMMYFAPNIEMALEPSASGYSYSAPARCLPLRRVKAMRMLMRL